MRRPSRMTAQRGRLATDHRTGGDNRPRPSRERARVSPIIICNYKSFLRRIETTRRRITQHSAWRHEESRIALFAAPAGPLGRPAKAPSSRHLGVHDCGPVVDLLFWSKPDLDGRLHANLAVPPGTRTVHTAHNADFASPQSSAPAGVDHATRADLFDHRCPTWPLEAGAIDCAPCFFVHTRLFS